MIHITSSKTDERLIVDFAIPGVPAEAVSVLVRNDTWEDCGISKGHDFTVKVRAERLPDSFAGNKFVTMKLTETVPVSIEFDLTRLHWSYVDGILRVSVPKAEFAIGVPVAKAEGLWVPLTAEPVKG